MVLKIIKSCQSVFFVSPGEKEAESFLLYGPLFGRLLLPARAPLRLIKDFELVLHSLIMGFVDVLFKSFFFFFLLFKHLSFDVVCETLWELADVALVLEEGHNHLLHPRAEVL